MRSTWRFQPAAAARALAIGALIASLGCEVDTDLRIGGDAVGLRPTIDLVFTSGLVASVADYAPPRYGPGVETKDFTTGVTNAPLAKWVEPEWP